MRILIIEDEPKIANSIKKGLASEGYNSEICNDGNSGLAQALDEDYDLVICDLMLPGKDGISIVREVRAQKPNLPILILTAKDAVHDKVTGLNSGADDYLAKPFAFAELIARTNALIRRTHQADPVLKIAELQLDPFSHIVTRNSQQIELSAREFALLHYLLLHRGAILSETQLLEHVWDYNFNGLSNVVAVHIKNLRDKIDRAFPELPNLIHTVRGLGYQIDVK